jgi:aspartate kinase
MSAKPWLVQKYGGTSIGKLLPTITGSIIPEYLELHNVAVVCSARSGLTKSTGTTSMLLEAMAMAVIGDIKFEIVVESIREDHMGAVEQAVCASMGDTLRDVQLQIKKDCTRLLGLLNATMMLGEISDRTADRVLSFGELLSCRVVAASLVSKVRVLKFYVSPRI